MSKVEEYLWPTIGCAVIIITVLWFCIMSVKVVDCDNYESLTGIKTTMLKGKCYKYVDGRLQIVKELE